MLRVLLRSCVEFLRNCRGATQCCTKTSWEAVARVCATILDYQEAAGLPSFGIICRFAQEACWIGCSVAIQDSESAGITTGCGFRTRGYVGEFSVAVAARTGRDCSNYARRIETVGWWHCPCISRKYLKKSGEARGAKRSADELDDMETEATNLLL